MKQHKSLEIIFENDHFIAINKPSGMLTIPDRHDEDIPSLYRLLLKQYDKLFIVHRLDKDTSGLILFAKNEEIHKYLNKLFEQREINKFYFGIVIGSMPQKIGKIDFPIGNHKNIKGMMMIDRNGKQARTEYEVVQDFGIYSLVKFHILTGRTHQIRVHSKHLGNPIVCDEMYGNGMRILLSSFKKKFKMGIHDEIEKPILSRLGLHSSQLIFKGPDGENYDLTAELPKDMFALMSQLKKNRH